MGGGFFGCAGNERETCVCLFPDAFLPPPPLLSSPALLRNSPPAYFSFPLSNPSPLSLPPLPSCPSLSPPPQPRSALDKFQSSADRFDLRAERIVLSDSTRTALKQQMEMAEYRAAIENLRAGDSVVMKGGKWRERREEERRGERRRGGEGRGGEGRAEEGKGEESIREQKRGAEGGMTRSVSSRAGGEAGGGRERLPGGSRGGGGVLK
eukprot:763707-Hanusia_phi.AAC.1